MDRAGRRGPGGAGVPDPDRDRRRGRRRGRRRTDVPARGDAGHLLRGAAIAPPLRAPGGPAATAPLLALLALAARRSRPRMPSWCRSIRRTAPSSQPSPAAVTLTFNEPIGLATGGLRVLDGTGARHGPGRGCRGRRRRLAAAAAAPRRLVRGRPGGSSARTATSSGRRRCSAWATRMPRPRPQRGRRRPVADHGPGTLRGRTWASSWRPAPGPPGGCCAPASRPCAGSPSGPRRWRSRARSRGGSSNTRTAARPGWRRPPRRLTLVRGVLLALALVPAGASAAVPAGPWRSRCVTLAGGGHSAGDPWSMVLLLRPTCWRPSCGWARRPRCCSRCGRRRSPMTEATGRGAPLLAPRGLRAAGDRGGRCGAHLEPQRWPGGRPDLALGADPGGKVALVGIAALLGALGRRSPGRDPDAVAPAAPVPGGCRRCWWAWRCSPRCSR